MGALRFSPFAGEPPVPGQVWRIDAGGDAVPVLEGIEWPNGIGFSPDGATMYACDYAQGIGARAATETCSPARRPARLTGWPWTGRAGYGWRSATAAGSPASRRTASLDRTVDVPADFVSSLCFGGDDLRDVYVTTIGALFRGRCDVPGLPLTAARV